MLTNSRDAITATAATTTTETGGQTDGHRAKAKTAHSVAW